jgi:HD-GYP domain-containing protein (c-di-GMP phosphodiesterase class II)
MARMCLPLQTPRRQYGALWVEVEEIHANSSRFNDTMHSLANQAAIALERGILLVETRRQAEEIESAYHELELTYDMTLSALSSALDARDRETEGHSMRVSRLSTELGKRMGFTPDQAKVMERGSILHDIGKIGISDTILLKPDKLTEEEWDAMRQHPDIGARIIEGIPFLQDALPVIRYHQERWDGSGYPIGLKGEKIPFQARIFAVADVFDALTSKRPYREPISAGEAIAYLREQSEKHFDQQVVEALASIEEDGFINEFVAL